MTIRRKVLLDENLPTELRRGLPSVQAISAEYMGWKCIRNGELCGLARAEGFEVLVTADRLLARDHDAWSPMGCVLLTTNRLPALRPAVERTDEACRDVLPGEMFRVRV